MRTKGEVMHKLRRFLLIADSFTVSDAARFTGLSAKELRKPLNRVVVDGIVQTTPATRRGRERGRPETVYQVVKTRENLVSIQRQVAAFERAGEVHPATRAPDPSRLQRVEELIQQARESFGHTRLGALAEARVHLSSAREEEALDPTGLDSVQARLDLVEAHLEFVSGDLVRASMLAWRATKGFAKVGLSDLEDSARILAMTLELLPRQDSKRFDRTVASIYPFAKARLSVIDGRLAKESRRQETPDLLDPFLPVVPGRANLPIIIGQPFEYGPGRSHRLFVTQKGEEEGLVGGEQFWWPSLWESVVVSPGPSASPSGGEPWGPIKVLRQSKSDYIHEGVVPHMPEVERIVQCEVEYDFFRPILSPEKATETAFARQLADILAFSHTEPQTSETGEIQRFACRGLYQPRTSGEPVPVRRLVIVPNALSITVEGKTQLAEEIADLVLPLVSWSQVSRSDASRVSHGTYMRVRLVVTAEQFAPAVCNTVSSKLVPEYEGAGLQLGVSLTNISVQIVGVPVEAPPVSSLQQWAGRIRQGELRISIQSPADYSLGVFTVGAPLPFDETIGLLAALEQALAH